MFGKSYSEKAVNELGSLIKLFDELAEGELQEEPITGIPFNSEFLPITLFMSGEKKEKAKKRTIANMGAIDYCAKKIFDGTNHDYYKFVKESFKFAFNFGFGMNFSNTFFSHFRKFSKDPYNSTFRLGAKFGERFYNKHSINN